MKLIADNLRITRPEMRRALQQFDPEPVQDLVKACEAQGAWAIDVNTGPLGKFADIGMTFFIEAGKRWKNDDFARVNWHLRKYLWMPKIFLYGIQRMNLLNDIFILSGAGVGGGSLNYANTLYVPPDQFFENEVIKRIGGKDALLSYYEMAKKMLGTTENPYIGEADHLMRKTAADFGREHTFHKICVGVYFGEQGKKAKTPIFLVKVRTGLGVNFAAHA